MKFKKSNLQHTVIFLTIAILTTILIVQYMKPASQSPTFNITIKTDKELYLLRQKVTINGNLTLDGTPATDLLITIQIDNPSNQPVAYLTFIHGNVTQDFPLEITNIYIVDFNNNPIDTVKAGSAARVCMTIYNPMATTREFFAAITVFDANMVPLQVGTINGQISPQKEITAKFNVHIPSWATSGKALICGSVYSKEPKLGGLAYALPKQLHFCISRCQQGYFNYQEVPFLSQLIATPGNYSLQMTLPPDPASGQYTIYTTGQVDPITIRQTSTTFQVEESSGYPPQASFIYWPAKPYINMTVTFDASSSTPEGFNDTITSYTWNFGDGTPEIETNEPIITHTYLTPTTFIVTLNVTDSEGLWSTTSKPITILPESGPTANFTWIPQKPVVNQTVTFNASSTQLGWCAKTQRFSPIENYTWNFGDGTETVNVTSPEVTHIFTQIGNYTVTLTVTDADGRQDTVSYIVQVQNRTYPPWDVDNSGRVDMIDLWIVQSHFGETPTSPNWDPAADVDDSGRVDMIDLWIVQIHFGETYP